MAQDIAHTGNTPSRHPGEQEPSGPGHRTRKATHRACTPVNRSQVAQDTADTDNTHAGTPVNRSKVAQDTEHARQSTERAHR